MTLIYASSLAVRLIALIFSVMLFRRQRHWALGVLAATLGLMNLRLALTWLGHEQTNGRLQNVAAPLVVGDEIPGLVVGVCMLISVVAIGRLLDEKRELLDRLRQQGDRQQLLLRELNHRVRNNLASILTLIDLSATTRSSVGDFASTIRRRVGSMAAAQSLLARPGPRPVQLRELLEAILGEASPLVAQVTGPTVELSPSKVQAFGMILQELLANTLKHAVRNGHDARITVTWRTAHDADLGADQLELCWSETAAPEVAEIVPGAGLSLVRGLLEHELSGEFRTTVRGGEIRHRITFPLTANGNGHNGAAEGESVAA
ncbi:MAG: sensor histidine kinase [Phycisphaerales bacterium]